VVLLTTVFQSWHNACCGTGQEEKTHSAGGEQEQEQKSGVIAQQ
jgi:hypothetical protein